MRVVVHNFGPNHTARILPLNLGLISYKKKLKFIVLNLKKKSFKKVLHFLKKYFIIFAEVRNFVVQYK